MTIPAQNWETIAAAKCAARDALIPAKWLLAPGSVADDVLDVTGVPAACGILTPEELKITETNAQELVDSLIAKKLTSEAVTTAFCKRAAIAQQLTNCLTEIFFTEAIAKAKEIDAEYATSGTPLGPLHGLPVSIKDCFNIEGKDTTNGYIAYCNSPATYDSEMIKIMKNSGAVLFCKTNVPTAMMIAESYNNVWGYTVNPYNRKTSSGGSSGGESALLAMYGSPLGIGTDIGGSIRIPASFCGLYALKPSGHRFPTYGTRPGLAGQEAVKSINGPMSPTVESVKLWTKTVIDSKPWLCDPNVIPIPWREVTLPEKLCFGLVLDDTIVRPTPPVVRALQETKKALEAAGHKVVAWTPYDPAKSKSIIEKFFEGDGGSWIASVLEEGQEPWPIGLHRYKAQYESRVGDNRFPAVGELWKNHLERNAYIKGMLDAWLATESLTGTGRPFDGVISPVTAYSACPIHSFDHVTYTSIWNICDQPAYVFPVTRTTLDDVRTDIKPYRSEVEEKIWERYDPAEVVGAPVSLQVVTTRLDEEKAIALGEVIAAALKA